MTTSSTTAPPVIESRRPRPATISNCPECKIQIEFSVPAEPYEFQYYNVKCFGCSKESRIPKSKPFQQKQKPEPKPKQAPVGSDQSPIDMSYYDLLGVPANATPSAIKKAYYMSAMKYHPDKNLDDPEAEGKFKEISEAYQILSDPQRRASYNQFGKNVGGSDNPFVDPEQFFKQQFGGEKFVSIIGEISIARDFKEAMFAGEKDTNPVSPEMRIQQRKERVGQLVGHLVTKLALYTDAFPLPSQVPPVGTTMEHMATEALNSFRIVAQVEVDLLKEESYGVELLHAIGYTYVLKADQWMAIYDSYDAPIYRRAWGYTSRLSNGFKEKLHIVSETVGTVKTAFDLQSSFTKLQEMEKRGDGDDETGQAVQKEYTPEEQELKAKLEQEAATKGMEALWRGSKLEVESVLREVCDETLGDEHIEGEVKKRRAVALKVLGEVYQNAKLDS